MPTNWETFPIECGGGLISDLPPIQQGLKMPGSASRLVNFEASTKGGYRRVNGYSKWDSNAVTGSGQIWGVAFFDGEVIAARGSNVYTSSGSGWTSIQGSRTQSSKQRYATINLSGERKILGVDGSNYPFSWDGSTWVDIDSTTDVQGARHVTQFKDHVFYSKGNLVTFSVPFDETDFTVADGAGSFVMPDTVTGMIVFRERLFIFCEKNIRVLDGDSSLDFRLTSVSEDVGCIEEDTIQEVGSDVMFLASDGFRLLGATDRIGDFAIGLASKQIQDEINSFSSFYSNFSSIVVRGKSQYRVIGFLSGRAAINTEGFIASQRGRNQTADNPDGFEWSLTKGFSAYSAHSTVYLGVEYIVFCNEDGFVYRMENGAKNFDGTAIPSSYNTPYISFTDPSFRKTLYSVRVYSSPEGDLEGVLSVNFDQDSGSKIQPPSIVFSTRGGGAFYGTALYGTDTYRLSPDSSRRFQLIGSGFNASFRFEFTEDQEPFIIDTILVEFTTDDRK